MAFDRGLLGLACALIGASCASPGDPCGRDLDRAHGALCEGRPESLETLWRSARAHEAAIALVVTCEPSMIGTPFLTPVSTTPIMVSGVFYAACADVGTCAVEDALGYPVQDAIVLRARTGVHYLADEAGAPHPRSDDVDGPGPQCLWVGQRYPPGRALVIVRGADGIYALIHAATVDADGMVSGAGTSDPMPLPLDAFRAL